MKVKVSELQGAALDWAVALANGQEEFWTTDNYSMNWTLAGPIIDREEIALMPVMKSEERYWQAGNEYGPTPLIAAMRCYVASRLGDEIEVPNELIEE